MSEVDFDREVAEAGNSMKGLAERGNQELLSDAQLEFLVPGLDAVTKDLQNAFPDLSRESIARILGLPIEPEHPIGSVPTAHQEGGVDK